MWLDDLRARAAQRRWPALYRRWLGEAIAFEVSDVARYLLRPGTPAPKDIPNAAPLAPAMYFEWMMHVPRRPAYRTSLLMPAQRCIEEDGTDRGWFLGAYSFERTPNDTGWLITKAGVLFDVTATGALTDNVYLVGVPDDGAMVEPLDDADMSDDMRTHLGYIQLMARIALTSICFAHCKGVTTTEHQQPRQQRRAAERAGRPPLVTYKTIDIAPVTRILHEEGNLEKTGITHALHICRGHFAHYTEEAPLFGKYTGTFYRPMHVRGRLERGAVVKDYRVLSPEVDP